MKKIILSLGIGALLMSGAFVTSQTLQNNNDKSSDTKNVAIGEKEPRLFSTYSASAFSVEL
ncbi:hypothetical protein AN964_20910 [Heyndrickxia shackletonii]|uniref:Uncharacterized protein n=1 Tax=Heyndrickxia shackletonii TaxID=157838 RepID=A0A0Q3WS60_9BACI|nr:hypothetical protein [Heyndrickxia shackletonii]KQL51429.1 hypothetical protein AN964_20910 [Heyndrickxia shackletonii]NEZ00775.1 hypothetical protein [Heyndrickxia shackletonii]